MKPDWQRINEARVRSGKFASTEDDGWNGAFMFTLNTIKVKVICSDQKGWRHLSASLENGLFVPSWSVMCQLKDIFWGEDEWVMELHPPADKNINIHPGCLHLWQPMEDKIPIPPVEMV